MIRIRKKVFAAGVLAFIALGIAITLWVAAGQLVSPARRPLQAYHLDWLNAPAAHGLAIQKFTAMDGKVPCLFVTPDQQAGPGERGERLRQQLADMKHQLAPYGVVRGTIVLLHGRKGRKEDLLPVAERFCAVGFRCILPDLPAHGESPLQKVSFATTAIEESLPESTLSEAAKQFRFPREPAALWGMSMGGAFAIRAAVQAPEKWEALIVVSSFDSLSNVIYGQVRWAGPVAGLFRDAVGAATLFRGGANLAKARPVDWASRVQIPVLVAHGNNDTLIPLDQGRALFDAFGSPNKRWVEVESGDHSRVLVTPMPLYAIMAEWLLHAGIRDVVEAQR